MQAMTSSRSGARRDPIHAVTLRDGRKRYRFVVDEGAGPDGRRVQRTYTFDDRHTARTKRAEIIAAVARGTHVARSDATFDDVAATWLASKRRTVREITWKTYDGLLRHATKAFGSTPVQRLTRAQVEALADDMSAAGLSGRTVGLTLTLLRAVLAQAVDEQQVSRNVAARVRPPEHHARQREAFTPEEVAKIAAAAANDRLNACWVLTLCGLRRSEVMGLRWSDVDLDAATLTVAQGRVRVAHDRTVVGDTKTQRGRRTLPLTDDLATALRALRTNQARERLALGPGYAGGEFIAVDEEGVPMRPERYSQAWAALCYRAGVRPLTLHSARHTSVTTMRDRGVPDHVVAAWHGHDEAVMRRTYSHALADPMTAAAQALAGVRAGAV